MIASLFILMTLIGLAVWLIDFETESTPLDKKQSSFTQTLEKSQESKAEKGKMKLSEENLTQKLPPKTSAILHETIKQAEPKIQQSAKAYRNLGALAFSDNPKAALIAYRRATQLAPDNAEGWNKLGLLLKMTGALEEAVMAYEKVLRLGGIHKNKALLAIAYSNLGLVYKTQGQLEKALECYQKALVINEILGRNTSMSINYGNLGNVYKTLGMLDKGIEFHQKALLIDERLGRKKGMAEDYANLGVVHKLKGNQAETKRYWNMSIELYREINSPTEKLVQSWLDIL
jgi:tetratricopeptide (TPR) repeat protein